MALYQKKPVVVEATQCWKNGEQDSNHVSPSEHSREVAARAWGTPTTEHLVMIPELAEEFARIVDEYCEALKWCSGSADFGLGGQARRGWLKLCKPLIESK